jgi:hypothetical protein
VEVCQVLGLGALRKRGIEWNRTAERRMVLTDIQVFKALQRHGMGDPGFCSSVRQRCFVL